MKISSIGQSNVSRKIASSSCFATSGLFKYDLKAYIARKAKKNNKTKLGNMENLKLEVKCNNAPWFAQAGGRVRNSLVKETIALKQKLMVALKSRS